MYVKTTVAPSRRAPRLERASVAAHLGCAPTAAARDAAGEGRPANCGESDPAPQRLWRGRGFTLIELLVVISMISILAAMGVVQYRNQVRRTEEAVLKKNLFEMRDAIDQYYADKGRHPASLEALVSDGYLRRVPIDPMTKSADSWQTVAAEPDPGNPSAEPGISDVKSGAPGTSLDGTAYGDL